MFRLTIILHLFIGATLSGVGLIAVLVAGYGSGWTLAGAALAGFILAFPVSYAVARAMAGDE
ncbi:MAG: CTP synthetase [Sediminimonas qiaohouensis]|uniref:CTP synthetase n=1 Tax=Sediminimonas qiaohouensis TaxID=552061 RepID=A0A7C9LB41_9RHOB|nr:CTP synthetase [Sediminimonas qiaohouensis]MTJ04797.1 CTP synthetase [Sediminimonas qiaohouensis]